MDPAYNVFGYNEGPVTTRGHISFATNNLTIRWVQNEGSITFDSSLFIEKTILLKYDHVIFVS